MFDLFSSESQLEHLSIVDAEINFAKQVDFGRSNDDLLHELISETPWRHDEVMIYGKKFMQPRLIAWYGDPGHKYSYSGIDLEPLPWTLTLNKIRSVVEEFSQQRFNSVLINYYRDHRDSMGFHSDNEKELGPTPTIASVSLGATRTFIFKHKTKKELKPVKIELTSGSLLIMSGTTQKNWKHGIDKQKDPCGPRVNMTFRQIFGAKNRT